MPKSNGEKRIGGALLFSYLQWFRNSFQMAHYLVKATPKTDKLDDLTIKLQEGAFISLKPFGKALSMSLRNARIAENGKAVWEEEDYCSPPLAEEREAVLDNYFTDIHVEKVNQGDGWNRIDNLPFLFKGLDREG